MVGTVRLGDSTTERTSQGSTANYAKFVEYGFKGHSFKIRSVKQDTSYFGDAFVPYGSVKSYRGLGGLEKAKEKAGKEMSAIAKQAFTIWTGAR
jgi:hypothetical protein